MVKVYNSLNNYLLNYWQWQKFQIHHQNKEEEIEWQKFQICDPSSKQRREEIEWQKFQICDPSSQQRREEIEGTREEFFLHLFIKRAWVGFDLLMDKCP